MLSAGTDGVSLTYLWGITIENDSSDLRRSFVIGVHDEVITRELEDVSRQARVIM